MVLTTWYFGIYLIIVFLVSRRDVTTGATGTIAVAPKLLDTLTLSQLRRADSAHYNGAVAPKFSLGYIPEYGLHYHNTEGIEITHLCQLPKIMKIIGIILVLHTIIAFCNGKGEHKTK